MSDHFRSGFISIIGRPNVGKSTLLNSILGEKLVITSDKPQTTRNRIKGIYTLPAAQIVFIDTPGIHRAKSLLNRFMVEEAIASVQGVDGILFLLEAGTQPGEEERNILEVLSREKSPVILIINKIDRAQREDLLRMIRDYSQLYPFREIIPVSALTGDGVERVVEAVCRVLPDGPVYFPEDSLTDLPERFIVAELIREKVFRMTRDEVPYSVAVEVEQFKERPDGMHVSISAVINVERDSQKGIVIGRKGEMLKRIGSEARLEIERLLDVKVFLELFVRVRPGWSENARALKELGYK